MWEGENKSILSKSEGGYDVKIFLNCAAISLKKTWPL